MIIQEIKMTPGKSVDLRESIVYYLGVKSFPAFEESIFVTKGAVVGTASRDDDGVGYEVEISFDQISPERGNAFQCSYRREISLLWFPGLEVFQELRERFFSWPQENCVGMKRCFFRKRRYVQSTQNNISTLRPVVIGK